jgi:DNA-binding transcriptional ArsR family regulator
VHVLDEDRTPPSVRWLSNMSNEEGRAMAEPTSRRVRNLVHTDPADVALQDALDALADPVRRSILRECSAEPDFSRACGTFDLPVSKATASHHFAVLRGAGLLEQMDRGARRLNRLRRAEFDARFPGLLALVLAEDAPPPPSQTSA